MNAIAFNTMTGAVSEYTGFGFQSITPTHAGSSTGLFTLGGDTDAGLPIVATVTTGKKTGVHAGRVAVRKTGSFNIQTAQGVVQGICHKHCRLIQRNDGYGYFFHGGKTTALPAFLPQPHRAASPEGRFASSPV